MNIVIRPAQPEDAALIHAYITELAIYERAEHEVIASVADIERSLFAADSPAHGLICLIDGLAGRRSSWWRIIDDFDLELKQIKSL